MPGSILPFVLAASALVSIGAMLWLMLNARAVIATFARPGNDLSAGPGGTTGPMARRRVWIALILFNVGWVLAVIAWTGAMVDVAEGPPAGTPAPSMERLPPAEPQAPVAR